MGTGTKVALREYVESIRGQLPHDGVDASIYGYPSGVVGLRLFLNPDFFANTDNAEKARAYWDARVVKTSNDRYYTDPTINADPGLGRPFRVAMSCAFCHLGPHPLNPPSDPENPKWENLSNAIGGQYWRPHARARRPSATS